MSFPDRSPLAGHAVLVTRPADRADSLVERIAAAGGRPLRLPAIVIEPLTIESPQSWTYAAILFVSPAAVEHGIGALALAPRNAPPLGAVGPATALALEQAGFRVSIGPGESGDSEGLLACPPLARENIAGRHVLIVRGEGGRERLATGLVERGAQVDYAEVYRRARPSRYDPEAVAACDIVTATSGEGLDNLLALVTEAERARLLTLPLAAGAARIANLARERGFGGPIESAPRPGDAGLMEAIQQCALQLRHTAAGPGSPPP